jgi:hypothetical protein
MTQVSVCPATAERRSQWRALRPVLILGGFLAIWWALMTGVAHADSTTQHHGLDKVSASVKGQHVGQVHDVVRRAHHDAKPTASKRTSHVSHQARPVTRKVRTAASIVSSTPIADQATKVIRTTVSDTVAKTKKLVRNTAAGPVFGTVDEVVKNTIEKPESSTGQGNSHSLSPSGKTSDAELLAAFEASGHRSASPAMLDRATTPTAGDSPLRAPSVPDPCASPSGSGSTSYTPVGITESSLLMMPSVLRDLRTWRLARLPGGPAYQPGSAPD